MKKFATSLIVLLIMSQQILIAQNVGIGTATPQVTLDVKGNIRTGGNSNFIDFDSLSGKITWTNSNLWVTSPQYLMKHSASAEGLYSNGAQLEYRNSTGNPTFFTNWGNGNGYFSGKLGINTINPSARLHIYDGASGITPFFSASMVVESNSHSYINLLSPDPFETGILFGSGASATSGVISYNTTNTPKGFTFSDNGNLTRMVIDNAGYVGIGTTAPASKLEITHNGASVYGTALLINQDVVGNADGPKIQFKKTMTASKSWTAGILNGVDVGTFAINEDGGTGGFGTPRFTITKGGNVGINTASPLAKLHVQDSSVVFSGFSPASTSPGNPPVSGPGRRLMWYSDKAALRAGYVGATNWDKNNIGNYSVALGYETKASADASIAMGYQAIATGGSAISIGTQTTATGDQSVAMGYQTQAFSSSETVIGSFSTNYIPLAGTIGWNSNDRLFVIGNGLNGGARSDALIVFKNGNATLQGTLTQTSDSRLKKNISPLQNSLAKLTQLNGYTYYWKNNNADSSLQTGVVAQEVQKLFPDLVKEDSKGILSVNYSGLIPVMIESIKEQQREIDELKKLTRQLLSQIKK